MGRGVIGGGWAARALHFGVHVIAAAVKPEMEGLSAARSPNAARLGGLTFAPLPQKGKLSFTTDELMAKAADLIQENIPQNCRRTTRAGRGEPRRRPGRDHLLENPGLTPTDLQRDMVAPERFCVAHPFNPVYLLPWWNWSAGTKTVSATIEAAAEFFTYIACTRCECGGRYPDISPIACRRPVAGDPAYGERGVATTGELDGVHHLRTRACAGRRWARTSSIILRAARAACGTCSRSSDPA